MMGVLLVRKTSDSIKHLFTTTMRLTVMQSVFHGQLRSKITHQYMPSKVKKTLHQFHNIQRGYHSWLLLNTFGIEFASLYTVEFHSSMLALCLH